MLLGLRLAHLRVRLELRSPSWRAALGHAAETGLATATSLELVLGLGRLESDGLEALAHELPLAQVGIARVIIEPEDGPSALAMVDQASLVLTPIGVHRLAHRLLARPVDRIASSARLACSARA